MKTKTIAILGADDPEMGEIRGFLDTIGIPHYQALNKEKKPVDPRNAYRACFIAPAPSISTDIVGEDEDLLILLIECDFKPSLAETIYRDYGVYGVRIDHHFPGDKGFDIDHTDFLRGSSIGQTITTTEGLGNKLPRSWQVDTNLYRRAGDLFFIEETWYFSGSRGGLYEIPEKLVIAAAADHCLGAAYKGLCPGVLPRKLLDYRVESRARYQNTSKDQLLETIDNSANIIRGLWTEQGKPQVVDLTVLEEGTLPEAPEAALMLGLSIQAKTTDRSGQSKLVLKGHNDPATVKAWLEMQQEKGRETYGVPERGFAGAYINH